MTAFVADASRIPGYSLLRRLPVGLVLAAFFFPAAGARADGPRDRLLRLVPPDMEVCLVVSDLREHSRQLTEAGWFQALWQSPLRVDLSRTPEVAKLLQVEQELRKHFQVDFARLRDDLLGDAVLFAYRSGPPGKAEQERGLFLLWARDPALLEKLLDALNQAQKKSGDLKDLEIRTHAGVKYVRRDEKVRPHYYFRDGALLAFASDEDLLKRAIDRHVGGKPTLPALAEAFAAPPARKALAALWINPRMLDAEFKSKAGLAQGSEAAVLKHLLVYWKALDGIVLSLAVRPDVELSLAMRARAENSPPSWRRLIEEAARPSALWGRFPENPLLALVGRIDAKALADSATDFLTPEARQGITDAVGRVLSAPLGMDIFEDVLPHLGPEWGAYVGAPVRGEEIPRVILALQIRPGPKEQPVDRALVKGMHLGAMLATLSYNSSHTDRMSLKVVKQGDVEVNFLSNDKTFPKGLQPAFALKAGYLVVASSPEGVRAFAASAATTNTTNAEKPLLRMTLTEWEKILKAQREPWLQALTADGKLGAAAAEQLADGILLALRQFDYLEVSQQIQKGQVAWTLRLRPLRK